MWEHGTMSPRSTLVRTTAAAAALLIAGLALTGCNRTSGVPAPNTEVDTSEAAGRAEFETQVTKTVECVKDNATIGDTGMVIKLAENCDNVVVSGKGVVLLAENIGTLDVTNEGAIVFAGEIAVVNAAGEGNSVIWVSGDPRINDRGANNRLGPAE